MEQDIESKMEMNNQNIGNSIGETREESSVEEGVQDQVQDSENENKSENLEYNKMEDDKPKNKGSGNVMREVEIEKMVLHCGGTEDKLEKSIKLLEMIAKKVGIENKVYVVQSTRRIPAFGISPGKKSGAKITIRDKEKIKQLLERFFGTIDNTFSIKQITKNQIGFGINEYIEVPGLDYDRDIGIIGFEVTVVFARKGKSVKLRKVKRGKYPARQNVSRDEIVEYLIKNYNLEVEEK